MSLTNMCRLCLSKDNLVWVFDKRFENTDNMKQIIFVTTGVEIFTTDAISQSICEKCCHIIINMFEFRKKSLKNDRQLKEIQQTLQSTDTNPTKVHIKEEKLDIPIETKKDVHQPSIIIHPTVKELYDAYPHIKIQRLCLTADVKPFVVMQMNAVEKYFNERNLDFEEHCRLALQRRTTVRKKTLASPRAQYNSPPCPINGQIIHPEVEDTEEGVLRPIKIKIIPKISITEKATEVAKNILKVTEANSDVQQTKTALCHKKRKYSEIMESPPKENEKPEVDHSPSPLEKSEPLSYVANVSMPLYTCHICDAVQNNPKDFKKHRNKHLRCQFCRSTFRSLESKAQHLENGCFVKKAINNFPCIELFKIETNTDIVRKFPEAFADLCPVMNIKNSASYEILSSESDTECVDSSSKLVKHLTAKDTVDVIEILSDDDEAIPINHNSVNSQDGHSPAKIPKLTPTIKPDVRIKDNPFTNLISSSSNETIMLQNLLNCSKALQVSKDRGIQTDSPDAHAIEVDKDGNTALLTNLKQHLHVFQVPIVIKRGSFCVSYSHLDKQKSKNLQLWNDLIPVDITKNSTKVTAAQHNNKDIQALSIPEEAKVPKSGTVTVSRPSVGKKCFVNVDIPHSVVSKDSKTAYDENYNNLSNSETTVGSIERPISSTHSHIAVVGLSATSTFPSSRSTAESTYTKKIIDSSANPSTTASANRPTTVIQWRPSSDASTSLGPQNIPGSKSAVEFRTFPVLEKAGVLPATSRATATFKDNMHISLANSPAASTLSYLASYRFPPNTSVYNIPHVVPPTSAESHKPLNYTVSQRHNKISNSSNTLNNTRNRNYRWTNDYIDSGKVTNRDTPRPPSTFVVNSQNTSNPLSNLVPQPINTNLNKSKENFCTTTSRNSLPLCNSVNVNNNTYWPPPSPFAFELCNVPTMVTSDKSKNHMVNPRYVFTDISQPVCPSNSTSQSGVSYATTQSNSMQYVSVCNKVDVSRNSLPSQTFNTAPPPPYSVAVTSVSNNNCRLPYQSVNKISDRGNSFTNSVNAVTTLPQHSPSSTKFPVNSNSGINDTVPVSYLNTSSLFTTLPQVNPNSRTTTTPQLGHIRVKNMQELA